MNRAGRWLSGAAWLAGLALMAGAQYAIRRNPNDTVATVVFVAATLAIAWALGRRHDSPAAAVPAGESAATDRRGWRIAAALILGVAALVLATGAVGLSRNWVRWSFPGWIALAGGSALASLALRWWDGPARPTKPWSSAEVIGLLGILALGTFLRFHRYEDFPNGFMTHAIEEQQTGLAASEVLKGGQRPWEFMLDYYVTAAALALSAAPTFLTLRIPYTIASALSVLPAHVFLRRLVTAPAALAGTFLFAVSSWNIIYSRCAHPIFLSNLLVLVVLAALVHFGDTRRLAVLPWIGFLGGCTLYSYAGFRFTSVFALVFLAGLAVADGWRAWAATDADSARAARRRLLRDAAAIAVVVIVLAALAAPLAVLLNGNLRPYFESASRSLANKQYYTSDLSAMLSQRLARIRDTARIFMHVGDGSLTFNEPARPMLDPIASVFAAGGLFVAILHPRRGYNAFLLFMSLSLMFVLTVLVQNLDVRRLQGITIFVAAFAALFADALLRRLPREPAAVRRALPLVAAALLAVPVLAWNYDVYFRGMARNPAVREAFTNHYTTLIRYGRERYARENGVTRHILLLSMARHFFGPYYYASHYRWLHQGFMEGEGLGDLGDLLPPHAPPHGALPATVIVQDPYERAAVAELLLKLYPGTTCGDFVDPDSPHAGLSVCDLPREPRARALSSTLHARYGTVESPPSQSPPLLDRDEPFIGLTLYPAACYGGAAGSDCVVEWNGTFDVEADDAYRFVLEQAPNSKLEVWLDDEPGSNRGVKLAADGSVKLTAGTHRLRASARLARSLEAGVRLSWVRNGRLQPLTFYTVHDPS